VPDSGTSVPYIVRIYDYWLGGKDNFAADREAAERAMAARRDGGGLEPADFLHPTDIQVQVRTLRGHRVQASFGAAGRRHAVRKNACIPPGLR
jgi:hypothetical protein